MTSLLLFRKKKKKNIDDQKASHLLSLVMVLSPLLVLQHDDLLHPVLWRMDDTQALDNFLHKNCIYSRQEMTSVEAPIVGTSVNSPTRRIALAFVFLASL